MMGRHENQKNHILTERRCLHKFQDDFSVEFTVIMIIVWWLQQLGKDGH
jgi:hypothetical protein